MTAGDQINRARPRPDAAPTRNPAPAGRHPCRTGARRRPQVARQLAPELRPCAPCGELGDPRAERYDDRYTPFLYDCSGRASSDPAFTSRCDPGGIDYKELNTNAVVRWEYRPGSAIFLVWQQGRFRNVNRASSFDGREDFQDMFSLHPNNTFLIKASYWFNY